LDDNDEADASYHASSRLAHTRGKAIVRLQTRLNKAKQHSSLLEYKLETADDAIAVDAVGRVADLERRVQKLEQDNDEMRRDAGVSRKLVHRAFVERNLSWIKMGGAISRLECVRRDRKERTKDVWRLEQRVRKLEHELEKEYHARRDTTNTKMVARMLVDREEKAKQKVSTSVALTTTIITVRSTTESKPMRRVAAAVGATSSDVTAVVPVPFPLGPPTQSPHRHCSAPDSVHRDVVCALSSEPEAARRRGSATLKLAPASTAGPIISLSSSRASTSTMTATEATKTTNEVTKTTAKRTAKSMTNDKTTIKTAETATTMARVCVRTGSRVASKPRGQ
jgi:polyhydroxyalkanoate synthesis regulator phasin